MLTFGGDRAEPAKEAFAEFLTRPHDHKAAQLGQFIYNNGSVSRQCLTDEIQFTVIKQVLFGLLLFYDEPEPPTGLYDELLNLPSTTKTIVQGTLIDFLSTQDGPINDRCIKSHIHMLSCCLTRHFTQCPCRCNPHVALYKAHHEGIHKRGQGESKGQRVA